jgi:hypothetical protein
MQGCPKQMDSGRVGGGLRVLDGRLVVIGSSGVGAKTTTYSAPCHSVAVAVFLEDGIQTMNDLLITMRLAVDDQLMLDPRHTC